jgi:hypothetical protein
MGMDMIQILNNLTHVMTQAFTRTTINDNPHTHNANVATNNDTEKNNNNAKDITINKETINE